MLAAVLSRLRATIDVDAPIADACLVELGAICPNTYLPVITPARARALRLPPSVSAALKRHERNSCLENIYTQLSFNTVHSKTRLAI